MPMCACVSLSDNLSLSISLFSHGHSFSLSLFLPFSFSSSVFLSIFFLWCNTFWSPTRPISWICPIYLRLTMCVCLSFLPVSVQRSVCLYLSLVYHDLESDTSSLVDLFYLQVNIASICSLSLYLLPK